MTSVITLLLCIVLGLNFADTEASGPDDWVEINKIRETDLYTGVFYTIKMKRFPKGVISWTNLRVKGAYYFEIDLNPVNYPDYLPGRMWENVTQWYFESSEEEGYYILKNKDVPNGIVTVRNDFTAGSNYNHLIVANSSTLICSHSIIHGSSRKNSFIKPVKVDRAKGMYQLKFLSHPEGIVTNTEIKYADISHFIHVSEEEADKPKFQYGGSRYDDTLFEFIPRSQIQRIDPSCC